MLYFFFFTFYQIEWWFNAIIGTKTFQHSALYLGFLDTQFTCKKWQWQIYCDAITACYSRYNQAADSDAVMFSGDLNIVLWKVQQFCCYVLFFVVGFRAGVDGSRLSLTAWNHRQLFIQNDAHAVAGLKPYMLNYLRFVNDCRCHHSYFTSIRLHNDCFWLLI